jgi:hypothetical protein
MSAACEEPASTGGTMGASDRCSMIAGMPETWRGSEMTAGQDENQPGDPAGPPQIWPPPPAAWPPPPGGPAPGQQFPGYAPAPSAPAGDGAPQEMHRPTTVRAGLGAVIGWMVLSGVAQVVTLANWRTVVDWTFAATGLQPSGDTEVALQDAQAAVLIGSVLAFVFIAVHGLFVWFAWEGRNWARIVLWVLAGLAIVSGVAGLGLGSPLPFLDALSVFQLLLMVAAVVLLALQPSNDWYRVRGRQRANGRR